MEIKQLEYVIMAAEMGSFNKASEYLYTTQSSVSKVIRSLEEELGYRIFKRNGSGVALTDAGKILYDQSQQIMMMLRKFAAYSELEEKTCFHIATVVSNYIAAGFAAFVRDHDSQEYCMKIWEGSISHVLELVEQGEAEIGFIYLGDRQRDSFCTMLERKGLCFEKILPAQDEYDAGVHLVQSMQNKEDDTVSDTQKIWLLLDGGVRTGNYMHEQRLAGALDALQKVGYILTASADELGASSENCLAAEHPDGGKVYLCPGYFYTEDSQKNITEALDCVDPDAVISVCSLAVLYDMLLEKEEAQNKNMKIGAVDCFSETNRKAFETKDIFGNSSIDCIVGKCQAMGAPAFIAMYNAITGHVKVVRDGGKPYRLSQNMWMAGSAQDYDSLCAKASNIYENVYTTNEIMKVLAVYNPSADFTSFKSFVEKL